MLYREWILPSVIDREIWQILHHINHVYKTNWRLWNKGGRKLPHQPSHPHPPTTFWQKFKKKLNCQHGSKNCQINQNAFFLLDSFENLTSPPPPLFSRLSASLLRLVPHPSHWLVHFYVYETLVSSDDSRDLGFFYGKTIYDFATKLQIICTSFGNLGTFRENCLHNNARIQMQNGS